MWRGRLTGAGRLLVVVHAHDGHGISNVDLALLDTASDNGAAPGDAEHVLNGHKERLVEVALGLGYERVAGLHELHDGVLAKHLVGALDGGERGAADDGDVVSGEVVEVEELADLHLDELQELLVVDHVALVEEHDEVGDADLRAIR